MSAFKKPDVDHTPFRTPIKKNIIDEEEKEKKGRNVEVKKMYKTKITTLGLLMINFPGA